MKITDLFEAGETALRRIELDLLKTKIQILEFEALKNFRKKIKNVENEKLKSPSDWDQSEQESSVS